MAAMGKSRLEAFSDGVLAIIITIMVLEIKIPAGPDFADLRPVLPQIYAYILSFVYLGIYWNNHHHMLHTLTRVTGAILWANLHLLFWLSLVPLSTAWFGINQDACLPGAVYGLVLLMASLAYLILQRTIIASQGEGSILKAAVGSDVKGKISAALYLAAIGCAFYRRWLAEAIYILVALIWLVPDKRIERAINARG